MKTMALCLAALLAGPAPILARAPGTPRIGKYSGIVVSVDAAAGKVTLKDANGSSKEFTLGPEVRLTRKGKAIPLSDVSPGDRLSVAYEGPFESPRVKSVHVVAGKHPRG